MYSEDLYNTMNPMRYEFNNSMRALMDNPMTTIKSFDELKKLLLDAVISVGGIQSHYGGSVAISSVPELAWNTMDYVNRAIDDYKTYGHTGEKWQDQVLAQFKANYESALLHMRAVERWLQGNVLKDLFLKLIPQILPEKQGSDVAPGLFHPTQ